jgi:hypothetical protein
MAHCFMTPMKTGIIVYMWIKNRRYIYIQNLHESQRNCHKFVWNESFFDGIYGNYINAIELITATNMVETFTSYGFTASFRVNVGHTVVSAPPNLSFLWIRTQIDFGISVSTVTDYGRDDRESVTGRSKIFFSYKTHPKSVCVRFFGKLQFVSATPSTGNNKDTISCLSVCRHGRIKQTFT